MIETKAFIKYACMVSKYLFMHHTFYKVCANNSAIQDMDNFIGIICCMGGKIMVFVIHVFHNLQVVWEKKKEFILLISKISKDEFFQVYFVLQLMLKFLGYLYVKMLSKLHPMVLILYIQIVCTYT